jgi:hypothetical protein
MDMPALIKPTPSCENEPPPRAQMIRKRKLDYAWSSCRLLFTVQAVWSTEYFELLLVFAQTDERVFGLLIRHKLSRNWKCFQLPVFRDKSERSTIMTYIALLGSDRSVCVHTMSAALAGAYSEESNTANWG